MAWSRKGAQSIIENEELTADEKVEQLQRLHSQSIEPLRDERDELNDKVSDLKRQVEDAKSQPPADDGFKARYEAEHEAFAAYKAEVDAGKQRAAKEAAYGEFLKGAGVAEKYIGTVLRVTDLDGIELEDGKVKATDELTAQVKETWADFIATTTQKGATPPNPPANVHGTDPSEMTTEEYMKYKNEMRRNNG